MNTHTYEILGELLEKDLRKAPIELVSLIFNKSKSVLFQRKNDRRIETQEILEYQASTQSRFKGIPMIHTAFNSSWLTYLCELLDQDWSSLFKGSSDKKFYVYFHKSGGTRLKFEHEKLSFICDGMPFYVGKGTGNRAFDLERNQGHGKILDQLKKEKKTANDIVFILKDGLTEPEALELESKLIYFFGTKYEKRRKGLLVNLDRPLIPDMEYETKKAKVRVKIRKEALRQRGFG